MLQVRISLPISHNVSSLQPQDRDRAMFDAIPVFLADPSVFSPHHATAFTIAIFALMVALPRLLVSLLPDLP